MSMYKVTVVAEIIVEAQDEKDIWDKTYCKDHLIKVLRINDVEQVKPE